MRLLFKLVFRLLIVALIVAICALFYFTFIAPVDPPQQIVEDIVGAAPAND